MTSTIKQNQNNPSETIGFCHLHVHTEYSLLDGMCQPDELCRKAKAMGMRALAITDHGAMYGVIKFYNAALKAGLKPIIGCEFYVAPKDTKEKEKRAYHLTLLAKNQQGYKNLIKMATIAQMEGFYYTPRIDRQIMEKYSTGLVALSGCLSGEIPQLLHQGNSLAAREAALWHKKTFEDYYFELQLHPIPELQAVNNQLIELSRQLEIPLVATSDLHYIEQSDAEYQDLLLCVGTGKIVSDNNRMRMDGSHYYLSSPEEMAAKYIDYPQALSATLEIAEKCNLELEFGRVHLPRIPLPSGHTAFSYLRELALPGFAKYYPHASEEIKARFEYELEVIEKTDFADYFLVTWDIIRFAKEHNIKYGIRGSAASSIVLHCLEITSIDPIKYQLVFERFLNIERKEMPDIDMDFEDKRRADIIEYVGRRYGHDCVAQIVTFGTLGAKQAVRDTARVLDIPLAEADRVSKLVPDRGGSLNEFINAIDHPENLDSREILSIHKDLFDEYQKNLNSRMLIQKASHLEGIARHAGVHAAGVVIAAQPLSETIPLARPAKQKNNEGSDDVAVVTQFDMDDIYTLGLLKMDLLGLVNHTILGKTLEFIKQNYGLDVDLNEVPLDDKKTFSLLSRGDTTGIFQLESGGMKKHIRNLQPDRFEHIIAMVALYRPGPMDNIPRYIDAKNGRSAISYPHESLKKYLEETYGIIVYQEQVMLIAQAFSGYTMGEADSFRKAMGKKKIEMMQQQKQIFIEKAKQKGHPLALAESVFAQIEPFAGYAFNKAHAASYALVAYHTAYFKANYPVEYMVAFLHAQSGKEDKIISGVAECRRLGIAVLSPCINHSRESFTIENAENGQKQIRFGLAVIKNVAERAIAKIVAERDKNGLYTSIENFFDRVDHSSTNKRVIESLVKAGVFDCLKEREVLLDALPEIAEVVEKRHSNQPSGQTSMFGDMGDLVKIAFPSISHSSRKNIRLRLAWEKELTGLYLSHHPFDEFSQLALSKGASVLADLEDEKDGLGVLVAGSLTSINSKINKEGKSFAIGNLEDVSASCEVVFWNKVYEEKKGILEEGFSYYISGNLKRLDDGPFSITCTDVVKITPEAEPPTLPAGRRFSPKSNGSKGNLAGSHNSFLAKETAKNLHPPIPASSLTNPTKKDEKTMRSTINLTLSQTGQKEDDVAKLHRIDETCRRFPGEDAVCLSIDAEGQINKFDLPGKVKYCPQLHSLLEEIVGYQQIEVTHQP